MCGLVGWSDSAQPSAQSHALKMENRVPLVSGTQVFVLYRTRPLLGTGHIGCSISTRIGSTVDRKSVV